MDDRVRIYELARKMNVPNQDIINILRELGYDIKSHSSTIDKQTVNQLTAAFSKKKKDQDEKPKGAKGATVKSTVPAAPVTQSKAPATKSTAKAPAAKLPPPPPPPVVKPRVLSRYRPDAPAAEPIVQTPQAIASRKPNQLHRLVLRPPFSQVQLRTNR
ncbi:MAG: translation initiation factor IF-2 N-terminal domain-containing protein [Candidatus Obscuribacter sp.]|nr:translation initiation factor IF-2 N-terminal domain-containing protein [Candidatus Obscuribacter sp.]